MKKIILFISISISLLTCDDIIEVADISETTINILAPKDAVNVEDANITFTWNPVEDADAYKIQIAKPNFENAQQIVTDSIVTNTFFSSTLNSGNYEWRVRGQNSGYATTFSTQRFTVTAPDPVDISNTVVVISSPTDGATFSTTDTIDFSWEAIEGATEYNIQLVTPNFDNPTETIEDETSTSTNFSVSNLDANSYEFRVKAKNSGFETGYTEIGITIN